MTGLCLPAQDGLVSGPMAILDPAVHVALCGRCLLEGSGNREQDAWNALVTVQINNVCPSLSRTTLFWHGYAALIINSFPRCPACASSLAFVAVLGSKASTQLDASAAMHDLCRWIGICLHSCELSVLLVNSCAFDCITRIPRMLKISSSSLHAQRSMSNICRHTGRAAQSEGYFELPPPAAKHPLHQHQRRHRSHNLAAAMRCAGRSQTKSGTCWQVQVRLPSPQPYTHQGIGV